jgi:hypothetical protein
MKTINTLIVTASTLVLRACGNSSNDDDTSPSGEMDTDFSGFVISSFAMTADDTDAVEIYDLDFRFNDEENPAAFDSLL